MAEPTKRLQVLKAVKALVQAALPNADVRGLDADEVKPTRPAPGGTVLIRSGDPGDPEVDLSPLTYNYDHRIPLEIVAYERRGQSSEDVVDAMAAAIGQAVNADRTLGGRCLYLTSVAPSTDEVDVTGAEAAVTADLLIIASYSTPDPLA